MKKYCFLIVMLLCLVCSVCFANEVTSINITGVHAPVAGFEGRDFYAGISLSGEGITNYTKQWLRDVYYNVGYYEEIEEDKEYFIDFVLTLEDGYTLSDDLVITALDTPKEIVKDFRGASYNAIKLYYDSIPSYVITFDPQTTNEPTTTQRIPRGEYATMPERTPIRKGCFFGGWIDGRGNFFDPEVPVTESVTYYANWITGYTVTNVELSMDTPFVAEFGEEIVLPNVTLVSVTPEEAMPYTSIKRGVFLDTEGYIWEDEILANHTKFGVGSYTFIVSIRFETCCKGEFFDFPSSIELCGDYYNRFVIGDYYINYGKEYILKSGIDVTFDSVDGSEVEPITNIVPGDKISKPEDPTKEGYKFLGWYTEPEYENEFDFDNTGITESITLYARWKWRINHIEIVNLRMPILGKKASEMPLPEVSPKAPYYVWKAEWGHAEAPYAKLTEDEIFEEGKKYYVDIYVKPIEPDGSFSNIVTMQSVTINGSSDMVYESSGYRCKLSLLRGFNYRFRSSDRIFIRGYR